MQIINTHDLKSASFIFGVVKILICNTLSNGDTYFLNKLCGYIWK